jgi:hypothetical protein
VSNAATKRAFDQPAKFAGCDDSEHLNSGVSFGRYRQILPVARKSAV